MKRFSGLFKRNFKVRTLSIILTGVIFIPTAKVRANSDKVWNTVPFKPTAEINYDEEEEVDSYLYKKFKTRLEDRNGKALVGMNTIQEDGTQVGNPSGDSSLTGGGLSGSANGLAYDPADATGSYPRDQLLPGLTMRKLKANSGAIKGTVTDIDHIMYKAFSVVGNNYYWGGQDINEPKHTGIPPGADCSGFIKSVFQYGPGIDFGRVSSSTMSTTLGVTVSQENMQAGDIIFSTSNASGTGTVTHVSIYMGNKKIVHAANKRLGIIITELKGSPGNLRLYPNSGGIKVIRRFVDIS